MGRVGHDGALGDLHHQQLRRMLPPGEQAGDLEAGLESLWAELQRHVAGQLHDDVALLLIERSS
jgi:hypothetical protein